MFNLLECSPIAQFAIGLDHRVSFWNKACEHFTGVAAAEMIGTDRQWQPFYPEPRPVLADLIINNDFESFERLYAGKNPQRAGIVPNAWEATDFFPSLNGKPRHIYFLAAPIFDSEGRLIGAVETLQDITEQRQRELGLEKESEQLRLENLKLRSAIKERYRFADLIGKSRVMQEVYERIIKAAAGSINVIIYGESGTGKELVARAIHDLSERRAGEFVAVNCGAIPENLLESEFFGHRKGAFTGAVLDKPGYLDLADGGTLFLDEIGELSPNLQVKLLRAIEGSGFTPVGATQTKKTDLRIISATNKDLAALMAKGLIREDFFYRIHVIPIHLPPLRERKEDLPLLIEHFLKQQGSGDAQQEAPAIPGKVYDALRNYDWPGNIRELQNVLHRFLTLNTLDFATGSAQGLAAGKELPPTSEHQDLQTALQEFERTLVRNSLTLHNWHRNKAAASLGVSRKTLFRRMKKLGLL